MAHHLLHHHSSDAPKQASPGIDAASMDVAPPSEVVVMTQDNSSFVTRHNLLPDLLKKMDHTRDQTSANLDSVEVEIKAVERQIQNVELKLQEDGLAPEERMRWWKKEEQLRKEKEQLRELEILKQKQQLAQGHGRPPLYPIAEFSHKLDQLLEATLKTDRATPQYSASQIGENEKKRLTKAGSFNAFKFQRGEESILSQGELEDLSQMKNEHQVVAFITPYLEKVLSNQDVEVSVYNSEEYKWIETSSDTAKFNEKPDLIVCHPAIINEKQPFNSNDAVLNRMREQYALKYGILSAWKLRQGIGLTCEAKTKIDNQGFGEVINYGRHLCHEKHGCNDTRMLLFDKTKCWLVKVIKGFVSDVTTFNWLDEGSKNLLRSFVLNTPLATVLTKSCRHFNLTVENNSFLGSGAFGFVFRASRSDGRHVALKVVIDEGTGDDNARRLAVEAVLMREAHRRCPDVAMGIEKDGFATFEEGAALLLSHVGKDYMNLKPQAIIDSLQTLHNHSFLHGDVRLENVVSVDGKPVWIDFASSILLPAPSSEKPSLEPSMKKELDDLKACVVDRFQCVEYLTD